MKLIICDVFLHNNRSYENFCLFEYLDYCHSSNVDGHLNLSATYLESLDVLELDLWVNKCNVKLRLSFYNPIGGLSFNIKNEKSWDQKVRYFDCFNIYPYDVYAKYTGRQYFFYKNIISWTKENIYLKDVIGYFKYKFSDNDKFSDKCNVTSYFFNFTNDFRSEFIFDKDLFLLLKDECALAFFVDIYRLFRDMYSFNLLEKFSIDDDCREIIKSRVKLLDMDIDKHMLSKTWHENKNLNLFGVNLGDCLEYNIMDALVSKV